MQRFLSGYIGVDHGQIVLFSDYENGGPMWTGEGDREVRTKVRFNDTFAATPAVTVGLQMWDISNAHVARVDLTTADITPKGFTLIFRTWGDTKIARVRVGWQAIGMVEADAWDV
ncbi:H-type lectin domain-containing protein [Ketogulonicigenium vulgare]|uniref:ATP synthase subunit n=1 Tax=Ketogulonicigenium vulgare (strain WSH-001) TaxID=759362 RepID=F9YAC3_KETVW|nr:H-type lectin domain-containing protein [Ketogulonicigenium vulgare]ADO42081.1 conserved hypothetical protein [Ketogulonicigenium vulgare Y25]AEM40296.1 ATP synthase subunit [Ketogulonicigenium vulgare WSH-001]ALJ82261.1 ATP synthase [Ketogulonicigenium vulgare]ANW34928.1 hypothetical protein KvSKV_04410 [Ketogulonicigenium vulgare]AOZ54002.1 ATP synthase subunits region ORF 7 [Ketogulonicigenium vulgare]